MNRMVFLPNRLFIEDNEMYVSFDISSIPGHLIASYLQLFVPIVKQTVPCLLLVQKITSGWDINLMNQGYRPPHPITITHRTVLDQEVCTINLIQYEQTWRFKSLENHGVFIQAPAHANSFFKLDISPYLVFSPIVYQMKKEGVIIQ